ncbi:hypothetical protein Cni_G21894 [Canna indica]|uniref:Protein TILLER ANGLE CONTROL 1 n=1 Tax=Canna indica TaxID=4628 RepID=A0AAQ3QM56_9LILI|nr:hypothetical protein Cni_G21894 [Canna indica]
MYASLNGIISVNLDAFAEGDKETRAAAESTDTEALLLHDMLNEILTLGTLGHHHPLISQAYSDSEEYFYEEEEEIDAALYVAAREPDESFKIKLTAEEERRLMGVGQLISGRLTKKKKKIHPEMEAYKGRNKQDKPLMAAGDQSCIFLY